MSLFERHAVGEGEEVGVDAMAGQNESRASTEAPKVAHPIVLPSVIGIAVSPQPWVYVHKTLFRSI